MKSLISALIAPVGRTIGTRRAKLALLLVPFLPLLILALTLAAAQDIKVTIQGGKHIAIAIPDLRGAGAAQGLMPALNDTLWNDVANSGVV
ncbi:MAG: hypothetical protein JO099_15195, partial [Acidobacteriia bacterium]|nr:hypothetical protein [Terriglobia bacterium]